MPFNIPILPGEVVPEELGWFDAYWTDLNHHFLTGKRKSSNWLCDSWLVDKWVPGGVQLKLYSAAGPRYERGGLTFTVGEESTYNRVMAEYRRLNAKTPPLPNAGEYAL